MCLFIMFIMNNRDYKQFTKDGVYHVFNRGNDKINIFNDGGDYDFFLLRLRQNLGKEPILSSGRGSYVIKELPKGAFGLLNFCLMPNHFHLLLRQNTDLSISKLMRKMCTSYSKYFNKKHDRVGTLFQDQFKAVRIKTDEELLRIMKYIDDNPVKAGLVNNSKEYLYGGAGSGMVSGVEIC
jgi:putative transposase